MRRIEAKWLLLRNLVGWRRRPYDELRALIDRGHHVEVRGHSGTEYQIKIQPIWDTTPIFAGGVTCLIDTQLRACLRVGRWANRSG